MKFSGETQRERERERETERDRDRDRQTDRQTDRQGENDKITRETRKEETVEGHRGSDKHRNYVKGNGGGTCERRGGALMGIFERIHTALN